MRLQLIDEFTAQVLTDELICY